MRIWKNAIDFFRDPPKVKACILCGGSDSLKHIVLHHWVAGYDHNYREQYDYHDECLRLVLDNPEEHGQLLVDRALTIVDSIHYWRNEIEKAKLIIGMEDKTPDLQNSSGK